MSKDSLEILEIEISNAEQALLNLETELMEEHPSYETLKKLADEVVDRGKRIRKAIKRDRKHFT